MKISSSISRVSSCGVRAAWLRRVLSCGVALGALSVGAAGAQAGELDTLKAQIEALQSRVNQIEVAPPEASARYPEGASYMTFRRGSDIYEVDGPVGEQFPSDRGFTIAITPTADLPAPVMEVSVGGYVKADFIYDTHSDLGNSAAPSGVRVGKKADENFQAHAQQSRFRIKSRSDTAVGEIRTMIEGDFEGSPYGEGNAFRLRHAWGEWDMTPNVTLGVGQGWSTHYHFVGEIAAVDFAGMAGAAGSAQSRSQQIQVKSSGGPASWAIALQNPTGKVDGGQDNQLPDLAAQMTLALGGASVGFGGIVQELHLDADGAGKGSNDSDIGYGASIGVDLPLGDMITLHGYANYGNGSGVLTASPAVAAYKTAGGKIRTRESHSFGAGATMQMTEASSINAAWSYTDTSTKGLAGDDAETFQKVHVNYMWQPVSKLRMGVEGVWAQRENVNNDDEDNLRFQFGTWFFF